MLAIVSALERIEMGMEGTIQSIEVSADGSDALGRSAQPDATYGVRFIQAPR